MRRDWLTDAMLRADNPKDAAATAARRPGFRAGPGRKTAAFRERGKGIGPFLRACRFRDGRKGKRFWSLRSVAGRAGITPSTLSLIENGKRRPVADDLVHLADVLGTDGEELLVRAGCLPESPRAHRGQPHLNAAERSLIRQVRVCPDLIGLLTTLIAAFTRKLR